MAVEVLNQRLYSIQPLEGATKELCVLLFLLEKHHNMLRESKPSLSYPVGPASLAQNVPTDTRVLDPRSSQLRLVHFQPSTEMSIAQTGSLLSWAVDVWLDACCARVRVRACADPCPEDFLIRESEP